jgi:hypothetical protein
MGPLNKHNGVPNRIPFGFAQGKFTGVVPPEWRDVLRMAGDKKRD